MKHAALPLLAALLILSAAPAARAGLLSSYRLPLGAAPAGNLFDEAEMLRGDAMRALADTNAALGARSGPIVVVTLNRLADWNAKSDNIEAFARHLFDQWRLGNSTTNRGVLLLVARQDRAMRIELGAGFGRSFDDECREIMDRHILPRFRADDMNGGIAAGVRALAGLAGSGRVPDPAWTFNERMTVYAVIAMIVLTVVSLTRSGQNGWGFLFWAFVLNIFFMFLQVLFAPSPHYHHHGYHSHSSYRSSYSSGGSGGGSSGGYSGGGGATGRW